MINPIWRGRLAIGDVLIPLRRRDPVAGLIHAALALRKLAREPARRVVRLIRNRQRIVRRNPHEHRHRRRAGDHGRSATRCGATFRSKPFAIRHKLAGHPLLMLPRIAQLAAELPRDLIEYNSGKVAISQDPDAIPSVDLDPVEVVKRIETAGAWMVLKRVENSPEYRELLEDTLLSVARARGFNSLLDAGFEQVEGFLFVSSPNSTTPFHLDSEDNFFVHIHGEKFFTIFDNTDRAIVSDDEIERSMTKHRNLKYDESFAPRGQEFHLFAGDGCYVPYQWPHWVRTAGSFSISMAITWKTREVRRLNDLHFFNSMLRGLGLPQQPPGKQPVRDALKLGFYRTVTTAIKPLRASMAMRRVLRRIALGKRANYYLKDA